MRIAYRPLLLIVIALCCGQSSCVAKPATEKSEVTPIHSGTTATTLTCKTAADCTIKNVGNCCGYYPACVHKDQSVDPEAVLTRCEKEGTSSICGFPEISACACVESKCVESSSGGSGGDPRPATP